MKTNLIKTISAVLALAMLMTASACSSGESTSGGESSAVSSAQKPDAQQLREDLIGSWGRLGEVMHIFYDDNTCIVGGMFGEYKITDDCTLVLTTVKGSETQYTWDDITANNSWSLSSDTLTVNGNSFERILEEETPETAEENAG